MAESAVNVVIRARDRASAQFAKVGSASRGLGSALVNLKTMAAAAAAAMAYKLASGLSESMKEMVDWGDQVGKFSKATGISTEMISAMSHAADISGASFEGIKKGLKTLTTSAYEASQGMASYKRYFDDLGVSVTDNEGKLKNMDDLLLETADAMARLPNDTQRAAIASKLFGRSGLDLIPMLKEGKDGILAFRAEAERLGISLSRDQAQAAENYKDSITRLSKSFDGIKMSIMQSVMPTLQALADRATGWAVSLREPIGQAMDWIGDALSTMARGMVTAFAVLEYEIAHWRDFLAFSMASAQLAVVAFGNDVAYWFTDKLPEYLKWLGRNWSRILADIGEFQNTVLKNMWANLSDFFKGFVSWLKGGEFDFQWTSLTRGFEATMEALPEIAERGMTATEERLSERLGGMANNLGQGMAENIAKRLSQWDSLFETSPAAAPRIPVRIDEDSIQAVEETLREDGVAISLDAESMDTLKTATRSGLKMSPEASQQLAPLVSRFLTRAPGQMQQGLVEQAALAQARKTAENTRQVVRELVKMGTSLTEMAAKAGMSETVFVQEIL